MSVSESDSALTEDEQSAIAMNWHIAMWDELIKRGIEPSLIALCGLSLTASKATEIFGKDKAASIIDTVREKIITGDFDEPANTEQRTTK